MFSRMGTALFFLISVPALTDSETHGLTDKLENAEDDTKACESFFLRGEDSALTKLPATWGEARDEFMNLCRRAGFQARGCGQVLGEIFEGKPTEDVIFAPSAKFCALLEDLETNLVEKLAKKGQKLTLAKLEI